MVLKVVALVRASTLYFEPGLRGRYAPPLGAFPQGASIQIMGDHRRVLPSSIFPEAGHDSGELPRKNTKHGTHHRRGALLNFRVLKAES